MSSLSVDSFIITKLKLQITVIRGITNYLVRKSHLRPFYWHSSEKVTNNYELFEVHIDKNKGYLTFAVFRIKYSLSLSRERYFSKCILSWKSTLFSALKREPSWTNTPENEKESSLSERRYLQWWGVVKRELNEN